MSRISQALWNDVQAEKNRLFEAIQAAKTKWSRKFPAIGLIHPHACTWSQVMDEFAKAEEHYRNDSVNGPRGKIKRYLRKLGESAPVFERWIGLLPAGDYGSGICGMRHGPFIVLSVHIAHTRHRCFQVCLGCMPAVASPASRSSSWWANVLGSKSSAGY